MRIERRVMACVAMCLLVGVFGAPAQAQEISWAYGKHFGPGSSADGSEIDMRVPAESFGEAMRAVGYESHYSLDGQTALDAWNEGINSDVWAIFGHANEWLTILDDPQPAGTNVYTTGQVHWADVPFGTEYNDPRHHMNWMSWPTPLIDNMNIAVMGGCDTAKPTSSASFFKTAWLHGIDSIVGFRDLIYASTGGDTSLNAGNYYWSRFAAYAQAGYTLRDTLSNAAADLYAKEARYLGYDQWAVGGTVDFPELNRFSPPRSGKLLTSYPFESQPRPSQAQVRLGFEPSALTVSGRHAGELDGEAFIDIETAEGVSYRRDANGTLQRLVGPVALGQSTVLSPEEALTLGARFAAEQSPWFDGADFTLVRNQSVSHLDGDTISAFTWRSREADHAGPQSVSIEVDRQSAAIVFFSADRVASSSDGGSVSRNMAIEAAMRAIPVPTAVVERAERDEWGHGRWIVTLDRGKNQLGTDAKSQVVVDARTGLVQSVANTA